MTPKSKEEVGRERKNEEKNVVVVVAVGKKTREKKTGTYRWEVNFGRLLSSIAGLDSIRAQVYHNSVNLV